jgi:hypothetical protein
MRYILSFLFFVFSFILYAVFSTFDFPFYIDILLIIGVLFIVLIQLKNR